MAQDVQEAAKYNSNWKMKYVILNDYLVDWTKGFETVSADALQPASRYYEIYYRSQNGKLSPTLLYYPEYYKTMAVRLYCFDGKQYTPSETAVISWEAKDGQQRPPLQGNNRPEDIPQLSRWPQTSWQRRRPATGASWARTPMSARSRWKSPPVTSWFMAQARSPK